MVFIQKCEKYENSRIKDAINLIFNKHNIYNIIKPNMNIVIKPNFVMKMKVEDAGTTHPLIIKEVAKKIISLGAKVTIAESPGGPYNEKILRDIYNYYKLDDLEHIGVKLNISTDTVMLKSELNNNFEVIKPIAEADLVINIAKLKTHTMMNMTCCTKNLYGIIPGTQKFGYHAKHTEPEEFAEKIIEISSLVKKQICIVDGIDAMEGNGPTGGTKRHLGILLSGENCYEMDYIVSKIIGFEDISYITKKTIEKGIVMPYNVKIDGEKLENVKVKDFKRPDSSSKIKFGMKIAKILFKNIKPYPIFNMNKCIKCNRCINSCPKKALIFSNSKIMLNKKECISCFCCHELCPAKAIDIKRMKIFNM